MRIFDRLSFEKPGVCLAVLGALAGLVFLVGLGWGSLGSWDEAFYGICSKEMSRSVDWMTLTQGQRPIFNKPPLYIWFSAALMRMFGPSEWAARFGAGLSGFLCVLVVYWLGRRWFGNRVGLFGALVLLTSSHFIIFAKRGMLDVPLTLFVMLALACFWEKRALLSGLFFGLALMTKGAAGLVVPGILLTGIVFNRFFAPLRGAQNDTGRKNEIASPREKGDSPHKKGGQSPFSRARNDGWGRLAMIGWLRDLAMATGIGVLIAAPWHIQQYLQHGQIFLRDYFFYHVVARASHTIEGHFGNLLYYARVLVNKFKPWVFLVPFAVGFSARRVARSFAGLRPAQDDRGVVVQDDRGVVVQDDRGVVVQDDRGGVAQDDRGEARVHAHLLIWAGVVFFLYTAARTKLQWYILPMYPALALMSGALLAAYIPMQWTKQAVAGAVVILLLHIPFSGIYRHNHAPQYKAMGAEVQRLVPDDQTVYIEEDGAWPSALYYFERPVQGLSLERWRNEGVPRDAVAFVSERTLREAREMFDARVLAQKKGWALVRVR